MEQMLAKNQTLVTSIKLYVCRNNRNPENFANFVNESI